MNKAGFVMVLLGLGGLAEAYPNVKQIVLSAILIIVGAGLFYKGNCKNEKDNGSNRTDSGNVLDRLFFLRR